MNESNTSDRAQTFSYAQFREVAGLSKKEADGWTKSGVIRAELMPQRQAALSVRLDRGRVNRQAIGGLFFAPGSSRR